MVPTTEWHFHTEGNDIYSGNLVVAKYSMVVAISFIASLSSG